MSLDDATRQAEATLERLASRIRRGEPFPDRYTYGDRPVREQVIRTHETDDSGLLVAVTRNVYGSLILNTARVMFLDIDFPEEPRTPALFGWLKRKLTGRQPPSVEELVEPSFERLRTWLATRPDWSARVYRTRAGLRYVFTHDVFDPVGREAHEAMAFLGADERYRKLCRVQQSFRARLTPKPWRIGVSLPPAKYPYESTRDERRMQEWQATYASAGKDYAVCELVSTLGADRTHPEVELIRAIHDETTRVGSGLPLA